ncbi:MFS transporter [Paenibacillus endoradicis]|uniref:MFS transporter n=1 Tax=Paenibacillus endoradicis TaxID=2972487 RepID=UPI0021590A8B|nr:MFS transporter [Paenibacillus endoradicis]MCR8657928.1 MFS transporter [Paenibacillus endoradicis]
MAKLLDKQAMILLAIYASFGFANLLSGTFVPVYLWKASQSYFTVALYALAQYCAGGITFYLAGKWVKEGNKLNCLRAGCLLSGVFYSIVLWVKQGASDIPIILGLISGIGLGLFWIAYNVVYFEITEPNTRDRFNGWQGLLIAFAGIVAPWSSGILISMLADLRGYQLIFTSSLIIFACCGVLSFYIKKRPTQGKYDWAHPIKQLKSSDTNWRRAFAVIITQGVREGVFLFLIGLVVYIATNDEAKVGMYSLLASVTALISYWIVGRYMRPNWRIWSMFIGVLSLAAIIVPLFGGIQYRSLLWFGIGTAMIFPLYIIPITSRIFDLIGASQQSVEKREELIVFRELGLTTGRLIGLIPFFIYLQWNNTEQGLVWMLLIVGSVPILGWFWMRKLFRDDYGRTKVMK